MTADLSPTDLQSALLDVARARAARVDPARLARRWADDAFVRPSAVDPRRLVELEAALWRALPADVVGVELSPVTPLGTCAALGPVDQNRIVSTVRTSEVISDPTNVLALEAARRRSPDGGPVHVAACHRVLRGQRFAGKGMLQHFRLFALVSSERDRGSGRTESDLLVAHLRFWAEALHQLVPGRFRIAVTVFGSDLLAERLADSVRPALGDPAWLVEDPARTQAAGYYTGAALRIDVDDHVEVGDGGFTTWTAQLRADAKERCLVSCGSTERLVGLLGRADHRTG